MWLNNTMAAENANASSKRMAAGWLGGTRQLRNSQEARHHRPPLTTCLSDAPPAERWARWHLFNLCTLMGPSLWCVNNLQASCPGQEPSHLDFWGKRDDAIRSSTQRHAPSRLDLTVLRRPAASASCCSADASALASALSLCSSKCRCSENSGIQGKGTGVSDAPQGASKHRCKNASTLGPCSRPHPHCASPSSNQRRPRTCAASRNASLCCDRTRASPTAPALKTRLASCSALWGCAAAGRGGKG